MKKTMDDANSSHTTRFTVILAHHPLTVALRSTGSVQGMRNGMEDQHVAARPLIDNHQGKHDVHLYCPFTSVCACFSSSLTDTFVWCRFGVFDGHGGTRCAQFLKQSLATAVCFQHPPPPLSLCVSLFSPRSHSACVHISRFSFVSSQALTPAAVPSVLFWCYNNPRHAVKQRASHLLTPSFVWHLAGEAEHRGVE